MSTVGLWTVTSYFNPIHYERRKANYRVFRERLNCPLVTVELSSNGEFELSESDADILIRLPDNGPLSVLFQKERMLNIGFSHVPAEVDKIAWIDCDTILGPDWAERTSDALDAHLICQPFSRVYLLDKDELPEQALYKHRQMAGWLSTTFNYSQPEGQRQEWSTNGFGWAARRSVLKYGLYPAMVMGSGDSALAGVIYEPIRDRILSHMTTNAWKVDYLCWVDSLRLSQADVGFVRGSAFHLWHGDMQDRGYGTRYEDFKAFPFDPLVDLVNGEWAPHRTDLQEFARKYFESRREDGHV